MPYEEEIILPSDPRTVNRVTLTGWLSRNGRFYPDTSRNLPGDTAESLARNNGATHWPCTDCGEPTRMHVRRCSPCQDKEHRKKMLEKPLEPWDGKYPVFAWESDGIFWHDDDIYYFLEEEDLEIDRVIWLPAIPNIGPQIDPDELFEDCRLDDDPNDVVPEGVRAKIRECNELIREHGPYIWYADTSRRIDVAAEFNKETSHV